MIRQGPIPAVVHGLYEYLLGLALLVAPLLLNYKHGSATAASVVLGVVVIFLTATTTSKTSLVNQVPISVHVLVDYALAAILIASPFLFNFSGETGPTAVFIGLGVLHMLVSIGTRYLPDEAPARGEPKRRGRDRATARPPRAEGAAGTEIPEFEPPPREP